MAEAGSQGNNEARELLIFPCNGNGLEALDCLGDAYRLIGFVDDHPDKLGKPAYGYPVYSRAAFSDHPNAMVLAAPGSPTSYPSRRGAIEGLGLDPSRFARIIHPTARISPLATIGHNVLIMAGVVVTSNAVIGNNVCILPNTIVHHDSRIGDWSLIGAHVTIAGTVSIGENCYIASGSTLIHNLTVGDGALVGLGSTVIRDVPPRSRVAGNPARRLD